MSRVSDPFAATPPWPPPEATRPILRFAPSPNGYLHLGHAYSALMNERVARHLGGTLLLRFEDIDTLRCRPELAAAAEEDLAWLGLAFVPPIWHQSDRFPAYRAALKALQDRGLVYPCTCSRGDIRAAVAGRTDWPHDPDGSPLYPGTCRHRSAAERERSSNHGAAVALRLDMAAALASLDAPLDWAEYREGVVAASMPVSPEEWGDALIARKDVGTSYHLSVVVDDAAQQVTDVVRGDDLFAATGLHRILQHLLGLSTPRYRHHRLIRDAGGAKLSKSAGAAGLREMKRAGVGAAQIRSDLGFPAG